MSSKGAIPMLTCLFLLTHTATAQVTCPRKEDIYPCQCEDQGPMRDPNIICAGLDNDKDLVKAAGSLGGKHYDTFIIDNGNFIVIPHDAFEGTYFELLEIKKSTLMALTDTDEAFVGLENDLRHLVITDCVLMNDLDWSIFTNLKKLSTLTIVGSHLETIDAVSIPSTESIDFSGNRISFIHEYAFDACKAIGWLFLSKNEIRHLKRSMLPNPALKLHHIDLSQNQIEQLPGDIFTNMPNLIYLMIDNNKILVLDEITFSPVWEDLLIFNFTGNAMRCDCRMSWIPTKRFPRAEVLGTCASPQEVKGKTLKQLKSTDLRCYL